MKYYLTFILYFGIIYNVGTEKEFNNPVGKQFKPALSVPTEPAGLYIKNDFIRTKEST